MSDSPYIVDVDLDAFDQIVIENSYRAPVLVDFWAEWCNPCKMLMPVLHGLVEEFHGQVLLAKVNSDEQQELAARYGVRSLPTVKLFRNGEVVDEFSGVVPESAVRDMLEPHLVRASDEIAAQAMAAYDEGRVEESLALFQRVFEEDPGNHKVLALYGNLLAEQNQPERALEVLQSLPLEKREDSDLSALITRLQFSQHSDSEIDAAELESRLQQEPGDHETRYQLANLYIAQGEYERGMELLLEIVSLEPGFKDGIARETLLKVFDMLGGSGPLVSRFRSRLYNLLY
ncbi:MAG: thioredoxin [Gammaproteobacteria bacterium]|nr:thioredoxin [Gammaproteobacteria bacterium]